MQVQDNTTQYILNKVIDKDGEIDNRYENKESQIIVKDKGSEKFLYITGKKYPTCMKIVK